MTRDIAQMLLTELDELDVRTATAALRLPGDAEIEERRHDIAQRRQAIIDALVLAERDTLVTVH